MNTIVNNNMQISKQLRHKQPNEISRLAFDCVSLFDEGV